MKTDTLRCWLSRSCCGDPLCNLGAPVHFPPETRRTSWMNSVPRFPRRNTFTFKTSPGGFLCLLETWESLCCQQHAVFLLRRWSVWKSPLWRGRVGWSPPPDDKETAFKHGDVPWRSTGSHSSHLTHSQNNPAVFWELIWMFHRRNWRTNSNCRLSFSSFMTHHMRYRAEAHWYRAQQVPRGLKNIHLRF